MPLINRLIQAIALALALSLLVACNAPGATTPTEAPTQEAGPTSVVETPQSTVTPAPTETPAEPDPVEETPSPEATAQDDPLAGTHWDFVSFGAPGEETPILSDSSITLQFEATGEAGGSAGCNSYGADYEVQGDTLSFSPIVSTMMACADEALMDQEQRYLQALQSAGPFMLAGESLTLWYGEGENQLNFTAQSEQPEPGETPQATQDVTISRIAMFGAQEGWALGRPGEATVDQVLVSGDGGQSWQMVTPQEAASSATEISPDLSAAAYFASSQQAWVAYARPQPAAESPAPQVWLTADGGQTWQSSAPLDLGDLPFEFFGPSDLGSTDGQFGWLMAHLGAGMSHDYIAIFTTSDGRQTWQRVADPDSVPEIQACGKAGLVFTSAQDGWLAGNCPGLMPPLFLYHTNDGGATWAQTELPAPEGLPVGADGGLGNQCGIPRIALRSNESVTLTLRCFDFEEETSQAWLYTTNDGAAWQAQTLPEPAGVFTFLEDGQGWYLAADESQSDQNSRLYYTMDGGDSWRTLAQIEGQGQAQVQFADELNGWVVLGYPPERAVWRSTDGGATWQALAPVITER